MEIGIDIEKNERFKTVSTKLIEQTFTKKEIETANKFINKHEKFCALWCAKEATVKAFSNLKIKFLDIEIDHTKSGKPFVVKNKVIEAELKKIGASEIKISLSHSKDYSTAVCLIY